jgi:hypothetical protein
MSHLLRVTLVIMGLCTGVIVPTRLLGSARVSAASSLFRAADGKLCAGPCLFGVRPGQTTTAEAAALLRSHPLLRDFDLVSTDPFRIEGQDERIVMITFNGGADGRVDEISLVSYARYGSPQYEKSRALPTGGTLGDVLSLFGTPDFIQIAYGRDPMLIYLDSRLMVSLVRPKDFEQRRIGPDMQLSRLTLFRLENCPPTAWVYGLLRWIGMAHYQRYMFVHSTEVPVRRILSAGTNFAPCQA